MPISKRKTLSTPDQKLVDFIVSGPVDKNGKPLSETACLIACGWKKGSVGKILMRLRKEIDRRKADNSKNIDAGLVKKAIVSRSAIEQRAMAIAMAGEGKPAVDALRLLADMGGHIVHKSADVSEEFKNKSEDELEFFSIHGYWPTNVGSGESRSTESESSSQIPTQPEKKPN